MKARKYPFTNWLKDWLYDNSSISLKNKWQNYVREYLSCVLILFHLLYFYHPKGNKMLSFGVIHSEMKEKNHLVLLLNMTYKEIFRLNRASTLFEM